MRFSILTRQSPSFLLLALLCVSPIAFAEAPPPETIERLAQVSVEKAEIRHLNLIGKLTNAEYATRKTALDNEERTLWGPYHLTTQITREELSQARNAITGLARTKISLLEPKWRKEQETFKRAGEDQRKKTFIALEADAQRATEFQRQRLHLQQQLDKGTIDKETFNAKDREAVAGITALRDKYPPPWAERFDTRLSQLTKALTKPPAPAPVKHPPSPPVTRTYTPPPPPKTDWGTIVFISLGIGGAAGFLWWFFKKWEPAPAPEFAPPLTDNYGSAAWAAHQEKPLSKTTIFKGVTFGKSSRPDLPRDAPGAPIASLPEAHTLIVARTRAGKGTRVIVPTLLRYAGSMLVIDPKGENAAITARTRRDQLGQTVHIVNPWGEMEQLYKNLGFPPATFNPLDAIDRNDPNAVAVAQSLAATICPVTDPRNQFWQGNAANVLTGVLLWISDNLTEQKTLARARQLVTMSRADFKKILAQMVTSTGFHGAISEMVSQYVDLADETYSGIMSNLAENTKFLSDPRIKASTASSSFSAQKLSDDPTTVYLVIPHDRIQTHSTWLRLVITAAMQGLKMRRTSHTHGRCMFLIDEFGSIGNIPDIPRDIALMSGYGLDFTLIVQGLDQLKHHYGEAKGTILSNCGYKWFCYVNDLDTAQYLSESIGKKTVRTIGKSKSSGTTGAGQDARSTEGESTTYGEMGRPLLTPDEVLNLGREAAILLHPFGSPYYLRPVDYWNLPQAFAHLKAEYPVFYWDPPLTYDDNPYHKKPPGKHPPPHRKDGGIGDKVF